MKLGIFDSGIGGEAVAKALAKTFPDAEIIVVNDHANVPYGDKTTDEIKKLTDRAIQPLLLKKCDIIILACNTATAAAIGFLREKYSNQKFIGIEPMIKKAAELTRTKTVAVFATSATLASERYAKLVEKYGHGLEIIEPDCSKWAYMIENNQVNQLSIHQTVDDVCGRGADVIVLGCTHYHWIKELIQKQTRERALVIEPSEAIGRRVAELLELS